MVNMSAKFDKEIHTTMVQFLSCSQAYFHICPLRPWPLTSKINRVHPLIMVNMSTKFDKETCNGVVSIVFTRSTDGRSHGQTYTHTHTDPQQRYYIPNATCCAGIITTLIWGSSHRNSHPLNPNYTVFIWTYNMRLTVNGVSSTFQWRTKYI